jgi:hypothetical protein
MADGRLDVAWDLASWHMAVIANTARGPDDEAFQPHQFNPRRPAEEITPPPKMGIGLLKAFLEKDDPSKTIKPGDV